MCALHFPRLGHYFRVIASIAVVCLMHSTPVSAAQQGYYRPYPAPQLYNNPNMLQPRFYTAYYRPQYYYPVTAPGFIPRPAKPAVPSISGTTEKTLHHANKSISTTTDLTRKVFIDKLLPYIHAENAHLLQQRQQLQALLYKTEMKRTIPEKSKNWLRGLAKLYKVSGDPLTHKQARRELLKRVDIIPASLALAQAAHESAWGKSRFATEAHNLYGIWTYDKNKGLVPEKRVAGKKHLVRKFNHYGESVTYYMHLLNIHAAYRKLREIRYQARLRQQPVDGLALAAGLEKYSARGKLYVQNIRRLIQQNQWAQLDSDSIPG